MVRQPKPAPIETELADRRRAVDSALGSLRTEGMEPEGREIMERFALEEIDLAMMHAEVDAYCKTIV